MAEETLRQQALIIEREREKARAERATIRKAKEAMRAEEDRFLRKEIVALQAQGYKIPYISRTLKVPVGKARRLSKSRTSI